MLVIKIELWPGGFEANKKTLATATIANSGLVKDEQGNLDALGLANYEGVFRDAFGTHYLRSQHKRKDSAWLLLRNFLSQLKSSSPKKLKEITVYQHHLKTKCENLHKNWELKTS